MVTSDIKNLDSERLLSVCKIYRGVIDRQTAMFFIFRQQVLFSQADGFGDSVFCCLPSLSPSYYLAQKRAR